MLSDTSTVSGTYFGYFRILSSLVSPAKDERAREDDRGPPISRRRSERPRELAKTTADARAVWVFQLNGHRHSSHSAFPNA